MSQKFINRRGGFIKFVGNPHVIKHTKIVTAHAARKTGAHEALINLLTHLLLNFLILKLM